MADIGSHWCDMIEQVTGLRITQICADLQTFHKTRKRPKGSVETFTGKLLAYSLGRGIEYYDLPAIRKISRESAKNDYRWSAVVLGIVRSTPFSMGVVR